MQCMCLSKPLSVLQYSHLYSLIPTQGFKSAKTAPHYWDIWPCWPTVHSASWCCCLNMWTHLFYMSEMFIIGYLLVFACVGFHTDLFDMWEDILSPLYDIISGQHYFCFVTVLWFPWRCPSFIWWCQLTLKRPACRTKWKNQYLIKTY